MKKILFLSILGLTAVVSGYVGFANIDNEQTGTPQPFQKINTQTETAATTPPPPEIKPKNLTQKTKEIQAQQPTKNTGTTENSPIKTEPASAEPPANTNEKNTVQPPPEPASTTDPHLVQTYITSTLHIEESAYELPLLFPSTAYDQLVAASGKGYIQFHAINYGSLGNMIDEINGIKNSTKNHKFWIYYINGKKANIGASSYFIQSGDVISWKYEDEE